ncbi:MAG: hypothetical protein Q7J15_11635 [Candidatus Desulfaltia sp.]|nr:hypothetical protein [Candidatus Desulfaltia sp.]
MKQMPHQDKCILHADIEGKNKAEFAVELSKNVKSQLSKKKAVALESICFPMDFELYSVFSILAGRTSLETLSIYGCKISNSMKIDNMEIGELILESNLGKKLDLDSLELDRLLVVDNQLERFELSQSKIEQLVFISYTSAIAKQPEMGIVFLALNEITNFQISNQVFSLLHITGSTIHGTLTVNNLKTDGLLIRDSAFLMLVNLTEIISKKYFALPRCVIDKPRLFTISRSDLSRSGFKETNVAEINFIDNIWRKKRQKSIKILDHCFADESESLQIIKGPYGKVSLNQCLETYRQLKVNFEKKGDYVDGGEFHYCEMEMCRLLNRQLSLYSIYKFLSGYGERPSKAIVVFLVVLFSLSFLHLLIGFDVGNKNINYDIIQIISMKSVSINDIINSIHLTFSNLTLRNLGSIGLSVNILNTPLWIFETIFGPLQIGLIALAMRRKIRR